MKLLPFIIASVYFSLNCKVKSELADDVIVAREATDGELYMQKLVNGEDVPENPGYLVFTAPNKLTTCGKAPCRKGDYPNFVMAFPVFIGDNKQNRRIFSTIYPRHTNKRKIFNKKIENPYYTTTACPECPIPDTKSTLYLTDSTVGTKSTFPLAYDPRRADKVTHSTNKRMMFPRVQIDQTPPSQLIEEIAPTVFK